MCRAVAQGAGDVVLPFSFRCFVKAVDDTRFILAFIPIYENDEDDGGSTRLTSAEHTPPASRIVCGVSVPTAPLPSCRPRAWHQRLVF
jgi:hypothetical protein